MMGTKEPLRGGDEYDVLTRWRRLVRGRRLAAQKVKRRFWKRIRKIWRNKTKHEAGE